MGAPIKFDDGVCIFREGERAEATFLLLSGQIEILKKTSDDFIQLELLSSGEVFGQIDVVHRVLVHEDHGGIDHIKAYGWHSMVKVQIKVAKSKKEAH